MAESDVEAATQPSGDEAHLEGVAVLASDSTDCAAADGPNSSAEGAGETTAACSIGGGEGPSSSTDGVSGRAPGSDSKHRLHHSWCLWALLRDQSSKDNWQGSQTKVVDFDTVEDFWRAWKHIKRLSKLGTIDLSMFKKGIWPAWEDETCKQGGRWIAKLDSKIPAEDLDEVWLNVVLKLIGEDFDDGQIVCGAVASGRAKGSAKVALWLSDREKDKVVPIGRAFATVLQETACFTGAIAFEDFSDGGKAIFSLRDQVE